jgi:uncharacterized protein (TIGR00645 family)
LSLSLLLLYHFPVELAAFVLKIAFASESEVILGVLRLIDLCFTGNLIVIVIFSGFENFVSRIDAGDHDRPDWMTKVDFGGLKQKLATSIVAISAIQVLKAWVGWSASTPCFSGCRRRSSIRASGGAEPPHASAAPPSSKTRLAESHGALRA